MKSVTDEFLKERTSANDAKKLATGVWYSGFERAKTYAANLDLPFVAVWSNGDDCSLCKKLEGNFMTDVFRSWMKKSGCVFFFGHSKDKAKEDRVDSKAWAKSGTLRKYPFLRVYLDGKIDDARSGNDWNGGKPGEAGAEILVANLNKVIFAKKLLIRTNPEWTKEEVAEFKAVIKKNRGYCPCVEKKTKDSKCMCKWFREKDEAGLCHCELYEKYEA